MEEVNDGLLEIWQQISDDSKKQIYEALMQGHQVAFELSSINGKDIDLNIEFYK